jgi:hypothetical protein
MKTITIPLIVVLFTSSVLCAQSFYGDSKSIRVSIVKKGMSNMEIPIDVYVKRYVEEKISEWQQKGEFERTADYQKRVNETARNKKVQELANEAVEQLKKEYTSKVDWQAISVSQYDADNETYLLQSPNLGVFAVPVPLTEAKNFKENWAKMKFTGQDYFINEDKLNLAKLTIINPSNNRKYLYDAKVPTVYASSKIAYNFKPIDVDMPTNEKMSNNTQIVENKIEMKSSGVDVNIPESKTKNENTFAVIIANENYMREVKVQYALNDGQVFKEYCEKTLGIPAKNIHYSGDATYGTMRSEIKWITDVMSAFNGDAKVIFYYAGHGMPNEADKSAYLLPVDGFSSDFETAIKVDELYSKLNSAPSKGITVFLDACFSGAVRDDGMLANARSVKIKPKSEAINGNMVVFSAATGDETAYPFKEEQHGLFTYFLLKKLQETKGDVDYSTLSKYIIDNVKRQSVLVNQKSQTPQVNTSSSLQGTWEGMKVK